VRIRQEPRPRSWAPPSAKHPAPARAFRVRQWPRGARPPSGSGGQTSTAA